jgi:hypothetical protein
MALSEKNDGLPKSFDHPTGSPDVSRGVSSTDEEAQASANLEEMTDSSLIDWDGPDDPTKPINWPTWKKNVNFGIIIYFTFLSYVLSSS